MAKLETSYTSQPAGVTPRAPSGQTDEVQPSHRFMQYAVMAPRWDLINAVLGGTETMRAAGEIYLPKHPAETHDNWERRRNQGVLVNALEMTLDTLVGFPFAQPIRLEPDVPEEIRTLAEDIDLCGTHIDVFARKWFREGLAKGFAHVLVEFPRVGNRPRTLADDRAQRLRPYWLLIQPEDVIAAYAEVINGREVITHLRFYETLVERVGFGERIVRRIQVREPGRWQVWVPGENARPGDDKGVLAEEGETTLKEVPLVTFYTDRQSFMLAKPPLLDLAFMNVCHWQSYTDQRNILSVSRFPMLAVSGADNEGTGGGTDIEVGPNKVLWASDPQGRFYYVESTGAAIGEGAKDLQTLLEQMAMYGAEYLRPGVATYVATPAVNARRSMLSPLQVMTISFRDAMETALQYTARWLGLGDDAGGSVWINEDFGPQGFESADLAELANARNRGDISRQQWIKEMQRRGLLSSDYDADADIDQMRRERETLPEPRKAPGQAPAGGAGNGGRPPEQQPSA